MPNWLGLFHMCRSMGSVTSLSAELDKKEGRKSTVVSLGMRHFALEENAEVLDSGGERDASYASHIGLMMIDRVGEKDMACDA